MTNRHRVLVVEDDFDIRDSLIDLLNHAGCDAVGAANGAEALKILRNSSPLPCLILLDLMMPVMDGQTFREEQLKDSAIAHIPIVVVSAYRDLQESAKLLNAASFLRKPPRLDELKSAIQHNC